MPGPDLTAVTKVAAGYLDDTVRVVRDVNLVEGGALNETTGLIEADTGDGQVWTGKALIVPAPDMTRPDDQPLAAVNLDSGARRYTVLVEPSVPPMVEGDVVEVLTARRDPQLLGRRFRVTGTPPTSTYMVLRQVPVEAL